MKYTLLIIVTIFISFPAFAHEDKKESAYDRVIRTGEIRCGVMVWPPYFDIDPNTREFIGFGAELYQEIADLIDIKISYHEIIVGNQVEDLNRDKIDAVCNDGPYVFSAIKFVEYSRPAYYAPVFAYVREGEKNLNLNTVGTKFVGIDGDLSIELAEKNFPNATVSTLPATTDVASMIMHVITKKADAVVLDPLAVIGFNNNNENKLIPLSKNSPLAVYPVGFSVKKGEQELLNLLNSAIDATWNTNSVAPILEKYDPTGDAFFAPKKPY